MPHGFGDDFAYSPISASTKDIAAWTKISDDTSPIHIYIEGDGNSFRDDGRPGTDPTPRGYFMRDLAASDDAPNVAYIARPCQFIMSPSCDADEWTTARFSPDNVSAVSDAVRKIANGRPIILVGYSGGALMSGLVIEQNPDLNVLKWVTVAGVLNHSDWTEYFGDTPLSDSLNLNGLPHINQLHYVGAHDETVPVSLSQKWIQGENMVIIKNATHNHFPNLKINFSVDK